MTKNDTIFMMRDVTTDNGGQAMHAHDIEDMTILEYRATFDESVNFSSRIQSADRFCFWALLPLMMSQNHTSLDACTLERSTGP